MYRIILNNVLKDIYLEKNLNYDKDLQEIR